MTTEEPRSHGYRETDNGYKSRREWVQAANAYPCVTCGAEPGEVCKVIRGKNAGKPISGAYGFHGPRGELLHQGRQTVHEISKMSQAKALHRREEQARNLSRSDLRELRQMIGNLMIVLGKALQALED